MNNEKNVFQSTIETIAFLRSEKGCPWDKKQTIKDLKVYLIEEVYELCDAIENNDNNHIVEEIGDVLLNLFMIANILKEEKVSNICDILEKLRKKIISRHPHVFGDDKTFSPEKALENWNKTKKSNEKKSLFGDIPHTAPALEKAYLIARRASKIGFAFEKEEDIKSKLLEEFNELILAIEKNDKKAIEEETGDMFLTLVNLAVFMKFIPQESLNSSCKKFLKRLQYIEEKLDKENKNFLSEERKELESLWLEAKERLSK